MDLDKLKNNPQLIEQLIGVLSSLLEQDNENGTSSIKTKNKKVSKTKSKNLFDKMQEKNDHQEDKEVDKILLKNKSKTIRSREFSLIDVNCRICGKKEQISPSLVYDSKRYKCNDCSRTGG